MGGGGSNIGRGGGRGGGRGRGRGRGGEGGGQQQGQRGEGRGSYQIRPNQGGGRGRGDAPPPIRGPSDQTSVGRPPVQVSYPLPQQALTSSSPVPRQSAPSPVGASSRGAGVWIGTSWVSCTSTASPPHPPPHPLPHPHPHPHPQPRPLSPAGHQPSEADAINLQTLKITEKTPQENQIQVMRRPDQGGSASARDIGLLVNHFQVTYNAESTILHYDVDVKPCGDSEHLKKQLRKSEMALIKDLLFSEQDEFRTALMKTVYDAEKNVFSAVPLPTGVFKVVIPEGEEIKRGTYTFTIKLVNELKLSKLNDYINGYCTSVPRDVMQAMNLVMKDNPSRRRIGVGRSFYSKTYRVQDDLGWGVAAHRGFQLSLKPTSMFTLCVDCSTIAFRKKCSVIEYLKESVWGLTAVGDVKRLIGDVVGALKGLKVRVNHRRTKQKYTIAGLTKEDARNIYFDVIDPEGLNPPTKTRLLDYFREKWGKDILHKDIPCLDLGNPRKPNYVPLEFCELVEGQRYPKEYLDRDAAGYLKKLSLCDPLQRRNRINDMVQADDGPIGDVVRNFGILVNPSMLTVRGRVIHPPKLKLGGGEIVTVHKDICHWNLFGKSLMQGKPIRRWALIDFTQGEQKSLKMESFRDTLIDRFDKLRIQMEKPLAFHQTGMQEFSSIEGLENVLKSVMQKAATQGSKEKLQLIVCVMSKRDDGYKLLKWVSETKLGVVTQCCLLSTINHPNTKSRDQAFNNLCLKINAKLSGSNFELLNALSHFSANDHVMFIGADVNHPAAGNSMCPSVAAVVGSVNWPAVNRYAARVGPQTHRVEQINNFGAMCLDLVNSYALTNNNVRPKRIVLFRDGVSEGQYEMVLGQELLDLKRSICNESYDPSITVVVAQKRHQTRLFVEGEPGKNVPPGTVVDTDIVNPHDFDFYLCSHYGGMGTSKPTHYYVLWDENHFSSDVLQKLIYDMCYTFVRCTKPVSLVPPVYYADLVAYRGRMYQEVLLQNQHHGLASHQVPSSSSSPPAFPGTGNTSFDQSFYNLHEDLKDTMFFV